MSWRNANISTPISGTVYLLPAQVYDFVPAGADLLHVADLGKLHIRAEFEEADIGQLRVGMPVKVNWDGKPGKTWYGHMATQPMAVSQSGDRRVGECMIALDGDLNDLPVDTNVALAATTVRHAHVLTIPREALYTHGASHSVYLVESGKLKRTPVETGLVNAMRVEITKGLNANDAIALPGVSDAKLADNMRVAVTK